MLSDQRQDRGLDLLHQVGDREVLAGHRHPAGLDPGKVQDSVDHRQEVASGQVDVAQVGQRRIRAILGLFDQHLAVAQDGVQGSAQLVAHVGQETALGAAGVQRPVASLLELVQRRLQGLGHLIEGSGHLTEFVGPFPAAAHGPVAPRESAGCFGESGQGAGQMSGESPGQQAEGQPDRAHEGQGQVHQLVQGSQHGGLGGLGHGDPGHPSNHGPGSDDLDASDVGVPGQPGPIGWRRRRSQGVQLAHGLGRLPLRVEQADLQGRLVLEEPSLLGFQVGR